MNIPGAMSLALRGAAALGLAAVVAEVLALRRHLAEPVPARPGAAPGISVLKPLCGVDDDLWRNLSCFADLDYPAYEVLLGLPSADDPAHALAREAAARWPGVFRVALQEGEPGQNPKVNQLVTLARHARHGLLVVSDSNVRVPPDYLSEIAAHLEDPAVGLVTHLIAGAGERRLGSLMENLHLAGSIAPAIAAAKRLAGRDVVMGKSMALRRRDLEALGGFESVMDVLAEDYLLGLRVGSVLGKRVALAHRPVENVTQGRGVGGFLSRCRRWSVLQRRLVGPWLYACGALANPVFLLALAAALAPGPGSLAALLAGSGAKVLLDAAAARELRPGGFSRRQLLWVPVKDLLVGFAWAAAFFEDRVRWRGRWLRVLPGTRLEPPAG